jgi:glycosyltransferase involved in cell wall biosynthesis
MRVLFIHRFCGWGGVTVGVRKRCQGLSKLGIRSDFLFVQDNGGREMFHGLPIRLYHTPDIHEAEKILKEGKYDVISSIDCPEIHAVLETLPEKVQIVCEVRTPYPGHRSYLKDRKLPSRTRCMVTPSKSFRRLIQEEINESSREIPIYVIPDEIEDVFLETGMLDYPRDAKRAIGWIGRLDDTKNYEELFEIASHFASLRNDVVFFIIGRFSTDESRLLYSTVRNFKGKVNFIWLPFVDYRRIHLFYAFLRMSQGCFLSTSRGETFSDVVLESMASRCPVVAADIEVLKELLNDGQCGALYEAGNKTSAVASIVRVLDDYSYREGIVYAAHEKVKENFTSEKVSLEWKMLFESDSERIPRSLLRG